MEPVERRASLVTDSSEIVSLATAKSWLGIPSATTDHDSNINRLIESARKRVERDCRRALLNQKWQLDLHEFPVSDDFIELPRPPLVAHTTSTPLTITYTASTGTATMSTGDYTVDTNREPGVIWLNDDASWPTLAGDGPNEVNITFWAGYGTTASNTVPSEAEQAILMLVYDGFHNRCLSGPSDPSAYRRLTGGLWWGDYLGR